jgi:hypothetical protein
MGIRGIAAVTVICASLAPTGCGEDRQVPAGGGPSTGEMASCLEEGGAAVFETERESVGEFIAAASPLGDAIFIFNLPRSNYSERADRVIRRVKKKQGLGGIMTTTAVNGGFTFIGVIGREGLRAGMPSVGSEALAKLCATRPPPERG